jgi:hypothetical protein
MLLANQALEILALQQPAPPLVHGLMVIYVMI